MKKLLSLLWIMVLTVTIVNAQTTVFSDDFEAGLGNWTLTGTWGLGTTFTYGGSNSLTESPGNLNYGDNLNITASMSTGVNLSSALAADVSFWAVYYIEQGFDYMYVEASGNGGLTWTTIATFSDENRLSPWVKYTYSLGAFAGNADVRVRFRFFSDGALNYDGMYIDDVEIVSYTTDVAPPLIIHNALDQYEGTLGANTLNAELIDISGIKTAVCNYTVDGGAVQNVSGVAANGDTFLFTIPMQPAGSFVDYWLVSTDSATITNTAMSDTFSYIAGQYYKYDNGIVDFVNSFGPSSLTAADGCAVRISLNGTTNVTTALIRNYTDPNRPNDQYRFHIWDDNGGTPGTDLITSFLVTSESTLANPYQTTRIDLRPYAAQLTDLTGDVWVGFTVDTGEVWVVQTTPAVGNRTSNVTGNIWTIDTDDFHFRAISGISKPIAEFNVTNNDPTFTFNNTSAFATSYAWDFGDGNTSNMVSPIYSFGANGTYTVCLTASNGAGMDSTCQTVTVTQAIPPSALFSFNTNVQPTIYFNDLSTNSPTSWAWDFGDGNTSMLKSPVHTYAGSGSYTVCLTASNMWGSDSTCQIVNVVASPPLAQFGIDNTNDPTISFTDQSTNNPTSWAWDFGDGNSSAAQNPSHTYTALGTFTICLSAINSFGSDSSCQTVNIMNQPPVAIFSFDNSADPNILFMDQSNFSPTSWAWDFGDGNSSTMQNPSNTYASIGNYTVCLTATNSAGSDSSCQVVGISVQVPVANFSHDGGDPMVAFNDLSTFSPTSWAWDFGDGNTSMMQNPTHTYLADNTYNVCLVASNAAGASAQACQMITIATTSVLNIGENRTMRAFPNPVRDNCTIELLGYTNTDKFELTLLDGQGKRISTAQMTNEKLVLDFSALTSGIYHIQVEEGGKILGGLRLVKN